VALTQPVLTVPFSSATLGVLRTQVQDQACQAGMPADRQDDIVLAVHELAANAVRHGRGTGRLRIWRLPRALHCQVDDGEPPSGETGPGTPLPAEPMHGLWVVRQVADELRTLSSPFGTRVAAIFNLPRPVSPSAEEKECPAWVT
jgi:anti-sigma regulatory factor (Ser/Thr protein kinase)